MHTHRDIHILTQKIFWGFDFSNIDILEVLSVPIHKHGLYLCLWSLMIFNIIFNANIHVSFFRFIPSYLMFVDACVFGILLKFSSSSCLLDCILVKL